jgi:hypothetical protein
MSGREALAAGSMGGLRCNRERKPGTSTRSSEPKPFARYAILAITSRMSELGRVHRLIPEALRTSIGLHYIKGRSYRRVELARAMVSRLARALMGARSGRRLQGPQNCTTSASSSKLT